MMSSDQRGHAPTHIFLRVLHILGNGVYGMCKFGTHILSDIGLSITSLRLFSYLFVGSGLLFYFSYIYCVNNEHKIIIY